MKIGEEPPATPSVDAGYAKRVQDEIEHYKSVDKVHDLPEIFHFWSNKYVRTKMEEVFGVSGFDDFYIKYIMQYHAAHPGKAVEIASLGAGNGDMEVGLGRVMRERGFTDFRFQCLDLNPAMLERGRALAAETQLADRFDFQEADLAAWNPGRKLAVVIVHQALHHMVKLEEIFANIKRAIGSEGYFLTNDMIGRNGHLRWPEALTQVHDIWKKMPDRYKYNHQLRRFEDLYENWDCSKEGFEGIRAQDILPLLVKNFHFEAFVAYGNIVDVFIDRGFGHNFDHTKQEDIDFIDRIGALDERLTSDGAIKPTQMIAVMRAAPVAATRCHLHWTPQFCLRPVV